MSLNLKSDMVLLHFQIFFEKLSTVFVTPTQFLSKTLEMSLSKGVSKGFSALCRSSGGMGEATEVPAAEVVAKQMS